MVHRPHPPFTILCIRPHLLALAGSRAREARAATAFCGGKARCPFIMHTDYVSMGGKKIFTPFFLPYIRSTLEVHFFDFILGRATPFMLFFFFLRRKYLKQNHQFFQKVSLFLPPQEHCSVLLLLPPSPPLRVTPTPSCSVFSR